MRSLSFSEDPGPLARSYRQDSRELGLGERERKPSGRRELFSETRAADKKRNARDSLYSLYSYLFNGLTARTLTDIPMPELTLRALANHLHRTHKSLGSARSGDAGFPPHPSPRADDTANTYDSCCQAIFDPGAIEKEFCHRAHNLSAMCDGEQLHPMSPRFSLFFSSCYPD